jgi:prolyl oligopeptidase
MVFSRVRRLFAPAVLLTLSLNVPIPAVSAGDAAPPYPVTRRDDVVEEKFGTTVADPYRWLENDVRTDVAVRDWVTAENRTSESYLAALPGRDILAKRMKRLYDYARTGVPRKAGTRYFYTRNSGLQNQSPLYVREGLNGPEHMLVDPNDLARDGATALAEWEVAKDGRHVVYAVQDGGTDWRILRALDVDTGKTLDDRLEWVKYSNLSWAADGMGFYYSRFDAPAGAAKFQATVENQRIWYHAIGTPQSADRMIYATPRRPKLSHSGEVTDDGRWLLVTSSEGTDERTSRTTGRSSAISATGSISAPT